jgi:hypothetical protein
MKTTEVIDGAKAEAIQTQPEVIHTKAAVRAPLDKYAEAKRAKKIAKRMRHRVTLRRSHTGG